MKAILKNPIGRRRGVLSFALRLLSAAVLPLGIAAGMGAALAAEPEALPADQQVLKAIHPFYEMDWSPLKGHGDYLRWNSFWWASPMYFDEHSELHPYIFASWEPSADNAVWTFEIDPDARFSDGSPITAADVKGTYELAAMPSTANPRIDQMIGGVVGMTDVANGGSTEISGLVVKDDHTLEVTLGEPDPAFHYRLATAFLPIVKAEQARDANGEEAFEWWHPENGVVVSGPFVPVEMNLDAGRIVFEPNENYFGPAPKLARIEIDVIEDTVAATALLQSGEYNAHSVLLTPTMVDDLGAEFAAGPVIPRGQHFWFNVNRPPLDDIKVRQALIMAIDRAQLVSAAYPEGPHVAAQQILNAVPGVDPAWEDYPYDPEAARQALAESSYGNAQNLPRLMMVGMSQPSFQAAAQFIAEQWRQNLGIVAVDMKPQVDAYSGPDQGNVQIFRDDVSTRVPDAALYLQGAIHSTSSNAQTKLGGYKNAEVDALIDAALTLPIDDPERTAKAQQAQQIFREEWAFIPWIYEALPRWANPNVQNMEKNLDWQVVEPWNVYLSQPE